MRSVLVLPLMAWALVACSSVGRDATLINPPGVVTPRPTPSTYARYYRRFVAATTRSGLPVSVLIPKLQREIARIQAVIKPRYRNTLEYTYAGDGTFVVVLRSSEFVISSCRTPADPHICVHECGLGFDENTWEASALSGFGRCQDSSPAWLDPKLPLPSGFWTRGAAPRQLHQVRRPVL